MGIGPPDGARRMHDPNANDPRTPAEVVRLLTSLFHLEVDAARAYAQAVDRCDDTDVRAALSRFRADHERHVGDIAANLARAGGEDPVRAPDAKGVLLEAFAALRAMTGTRGALA